MTSPEADAQDGFMKLAKLCMWGAATALAWSAAAGSIAPRDLRCEYLEDPEGIDALRPRLSWKLQATEPERVARGLRQTAYRILAASRPELLEPGKADLWDSGKVASDRSALVPYAGRPLASRRRAWWKVRVWDQAGEPSEWSRAGCWSMGLLSPEDWQARWIGKDEARGTGTPEGMVWIWAPEEDARTAAPTGARLFRRTFEIPGDAPPAEAVVWITADNRYEAFLNGERLGGGDNFKRLDRLDATRFVRPGKNVLAVKAINEGDAPNPAGLLARIEWRLASGKTGRIDGDAAWKTARSASGDWRAPDFDDSGWRSARAAGAMGCAPWGKPGVEPNVQLPARCLRKEFLLRRKPRRAVAYMAGLGLSELWINGRKAGDAVLSPGLTEYTKRVFYVTYDVTDLLREGWNAAGILLGNGRFFAPRQTIPTSTRTYGCPKVLAQIEVEFADGARAVIGTDGSWKLTDQGPIRANNEYDGEEYDARLEMPGWTKPGFDDRKWIPAQIVQPPAGRLEAQMIRPIRVTETLRPVSMRQAEPGVWIFDMGQNMVGWCRLRVKGPAGARVTLRHAETLDAQGRLYTANLRSAKATDVYILKGEGEEVYEPRFTYHGFRYVEVRGYPGRPSLDSIEGRVVHDDLETAGYWSCSNPLLNRILRNVRWGVRGNYRSIPTDCPQRDERQGWLGDRSAESRGEGYLFDVAALYAKWVRDMEDSQKPNGSVPDVCPAYWPIYSDNVVWPSSTVIIPGHLWALYGDTNLIARHYPSMRRWMEHMYGFARDNVLARDQYGDWCAPPEDPKLIHSKDPARKTHKKILATGYYVHCCRLMARYARLLGRDEDAQMYARRADAMTAALNRELWRPEAGYYDNGSQTACVLPLAFGLAPKGQEERILKRLLEKIEVESRGHIGTGLVGGQWLMRTLTDWGQGNLAYRIATQTDYPSWGYMIRKGATTIWELWNGDTADPAMNSHNHVMLVGDLVIWMYEYLAGIRPDPERPGFRHVVMKPFLPGDLRFVRAGHKSLYGWIGSAWERRDGRFIWEIELPPNTTATVSVPAASAEGVTESGRPAARAMGVRFLRQEPGRAVYEVGSGRYRFESELPGGLR